MEIKRTKPHYDVSAGLIWQEGKVLITKRPEGGHLAGFWEFPGGKRENGETLEACLEREVREELGVEIKTDRRLITVRHEYNSKRISLHVFHCSIMKGRPIPQEGQESRWVHPTDLKNYTFPPPDQEVIACLTRTSGL